MFVNWLVGLTFLPSVFGYEPRLSVYWTLTIEVTFYIWVFAFIVLGVWKRHLSTIMIAWLTISMLNQFAIQSELLAKVFITGFAGHFCAGMTLYQVVRRRQTAVTPLVLIMSWICFYNANIAYFVYMQKAFGFTVDQRFVPFIGPLIVAAVYASSKVELEAKAFAKACNVLGLASYPLYLIHTDVGHGGRMYLDRFGYRYPSLLEVVTPWIHMSIAVGLSIAISIIFAMVIEPPARKTLRAALACIASVTRRSKKSRGLAQSK
ncbi:peptidoglycan/LPS O-acetylase OafA/YrhL [Rhizobium sp. BK176]|nr:acyltransferase family protein [Rhizobium sp. BK176]MCS4089981.1 peptidoglycan/LPS O-acetylase OafA/YrhL [Rhizobium sp. BK176]